MMKRWLPSPPLSVALFVIWLLLNQSLHVATLLLAAPSTTSTWSTRPAA